jgi:sugar lactone lactonase YvrE
MNHRYFFRLKRPIQGKHHRGVSLAFTAILPFLLGITASAQIQYTPVVNTYAGGATTSTLCTNTTDTIGDGCVATSAILDGPTTGESDAAGNFYFPDSTNNVVRRIDAVTGIITVVAGEFGSTALCAGKTDSIGDGCLATQAPLSNPRCVRFDRAGNLVIADVTNQVIRSVNKTTGIITLLLGEIGLTSRTPPKNTAPFTPLTTTLDNPYIFMFDPAGNMIVSNSTGDFLPIAIAINGLIDPNNSKVYDLAGTGGAAGSGTTDGNGGLAAAATFATPRGLALDAGENVYVGDYNDEQVRRISSPGANGQVTAANIIAGTIVDFAGTGTDGTTGNGGAATAAELASPQGLGFDNAGTLYIEQYSSPNDFIRTVNPTVNIINNYAGTGPATFTGDGGPALQATFYTPTALKFNLGNRMTVADSSNNRLRNIYPTPFFSALSVGTKISQNAAIVATTAVTPSTATSANTEFVVGTPTGCSLGTALASGAYCTFPIQFAPAGPGLRSGQLKLTDSSSNVYTDTLVGVGLAPAAAFYGGTVTTLAGNGTAGSTGNGGLATAALVNAPRGGAFDSLGNFFFSDSGNNVIREIVKSSGNITIVAGNGTGGFNGDGTAATSAELNAPTGIAIDPAGNLYIADAGNNRIREVSANTGMISTIAGTGMAGYTGDTGLATLATFNKPSGIAIDNAGTLYIADTGNNALRAFSPLGGVIVTLAGTGTAGYVGDNGVPQLAQLNAPSAVTVDLAGNIYVADTGNAVVRRIVPIVFGIINFQGTLSTYAGTAGGTANTGDGGPAVSAGLLTPAGLGVDAAGDLYIAAGGVVRMVSPSGTINTIAGTGAAGSYSGEDGSATSAVFPAPAQNLAVDQVGNIVLSDTVGNRLISISAANGGPVVFNAQVYNTSSPPQSLTMYNTGNQPLTLSKIVVPTGFTLSTGINACTSTTVLAVAASCTFTITFSPPSVANYSSQITITDNALNNASSTQIIPVTGNGVGNLNGTTTKVTFSPSAPTYGTTVTIFATVTGGTNPSGKVNFVINSKTTMTEPLINGIATLTLSGLAAGTDSITANYLGDSVNAGSSDTELLIIAPAVLTVTANNLTKFPTQANPTLTYTITGEVNNDNAATAFSGAPTLSTTATTTSPVGTYPITVTQGTLTSTNYTFVFVPGTLTVLAPYFTITVAPTALSIASGQIGTTTVTITPTVGYAGTVNLACGPVPADVVCTFNATSVPVSGSPVSLQLTISTNNHSEIGALQRNQLKRTPQLLFLAFGLPFLSMATLFTKGKRRRYMIGNVMTMLLLLGMQSLTGCAQATQDAGSFSGSITVTGTDSVNASTSSQALLSLTIH